MQPSDTKDPQPRLPELTGRNWRTIARQVATQEPAAHLVLPHAGVHAELNPGYVCYSGYETVVHDLNEGEIRAKALDAFNEMEERFDTDYPTLNPKKFTPGCMGMQIIRLSGSEQGYGIYYHSSMRQNKKPIYDGTDVQFTENFKDLMARDDGEMPPHRTEYRCTEPGLFTNSGAAHPGSGAGSRICFVDRNGQFIPPCGDQLGPESGQIGCHHIAATANAITIRDGFASTTVGDTTSYFWYHPKQFRPQISCRMNSRQLHSTARRIATAIKTEGAAETVDAIDPGALKEITEIAEKAMKMLSFELDERVVSKMTNRLEFSNAYNKAFQTASELGCAIVSKMVKEVVNEEVEQPAGDLAEGAVEEVRQRQILK